MNLVKFNTSYTYYNFSGEYSENDIMFFALTFNFPMGGGSR